MTTRNRSIVSDSMIATAVREARERRIEMAGIDNPAALVAAFLDVIEDATAEAFAEMLDQCDHDARELFGEADSYIGEVDA